MLSLMIVGLILGVFELYIFRDALSANVYYNPGAHDWYIFWSSNIPPFLIAGLLNAKYLTLMKNQ